MKWLNITGLIFQFAAFWFAAPELLGIEALKRFEKGLISFISKIPTAIIAICAIVIGVSMSFFGIQKGMQAADSNASDIIATMITIIVLSIVIMVYFIFYAKKTQDWMVTKYATPLIQKLIDNGKSRKTALIVGAVLFTLGFLFQLIALILN